MYLYLRHRKTNGFLTNNCSSGCEVIATASPHNFDLCKRLGADKVFDYRDPDVGAKIREATNDSLKLVFDTISEKGSPEISAAAISSKGGHYSSILAVSDFPRKDVKNSFTLAYTAIGERFSEQLPANKADYDFGYEFWRISENLINDEKIKPHTAEVRPGGLGGIAQGLKDLENGKVSGVKLVYTIE